MEFPRRPSPLAAVVHALRAPTRRDGFLDAVRATATLRVVVWHMFGFAFISYLFAAMPAMFFVAGSLFAASAARRTSGSVLADRIRRIVPPYWLFVGLVWAATILVAGWQGRDVPWTGAVTWLVPVVDPQTLWWEGGWLSSHLWFLRALLWLLLLAPLLLALVRRFGAGVLATGAALVLVLDRCQRMPELAVGAAPRLWWYLGDFALYGTFFAAGFWFHQRHGLRDWPVRRWLVGAGACAAFAAAWRLTQPVPLGVVNNSHPLHLFVGGAWLCAFLAARDLITRFVARPGPAAVVGAVGRRSLTIYLWHTAVLIAVLEFLELRGSPRGWVNWTAYVGMATVGIVVAVVLLGWVEDLAAGRRRIRWPTHELSGVRRSPVAAMAACCAVLLVAVQPWAATGDHASATRRAVVPRPAVPSQQPPLPEYSAATADPGAPVDLSPRQLLARFLADTHAAGISAAVWTPDEHVWSGAAGVWPDTGDAARVGDRFAAMSVTKVFTAALVYRLVDRGILDLDAPLPELEAVPDFPYEDQLTLAILLSHRSGLVNYRDTPEYGADPAAVVTPVDAVAASGRLPLDFEPDSRYAYSSVNYLVVGLVLEQVTGEPVDGQIAALIDELGLARTTHSAPLPGEPHGGAAGIETNVTDLVRAGKLLLRDHVTMSEEAYGRFTSADEATGAGPGTMRLCPCSVDGSGSRVFALLGYFGGTTLLAYVPAVDAVVAVNLTESLWEPWRYDSAATLTRDLAHAVAALRSANSAGSDRAAAKG